MYSILNEINKTELDLEKFKITEHYNVIDRKVLAPSRIMLVGLLHNMNSVDLEYQQWNASSCYPHEALSRALRGCELPQICTYFLGLHILQNC